MRTENEIINNLYIPGYMNRVELAHLDNMISELTPGSIAVEVGSMHGRSAYCLAKSNPDVVLFCIDHWLGEDIASFKITGGVTCVNSLEVFLENTRDCPNIIHKQITQTNIEWNDELVDMVFIDAGSHSNPIEWEIVQYWLPKIKPGGILAGHDHHPNFPDVIQNTTILEKLGLNRLRMLSDSKIWSFKI